MNKYFISFLLASVFVSGIFSKFFSVIKNDSYGLLTPGYGIVGVADLDYDRAQKEITPYNPMDAFGSLHWQCFGKDVLKAGFRFWRGKDGMGPWNKTFKMCMIDIEVSLEKDPQLYVDRRAHRIEYCRAFIKAWRRITQNEKIVCLNGDAGFYSMIENSRRVKLWTWEKFKTHKGCYSYFSKSCDNLKYTTKPYR